MKKQNIYIYRTRTLTQHEFVVKCVNFAVEFQDTLCHTHTIFSSSEIHKATPTTLQRFFYKRLWLFIWLV